MRIAGIVNRLCVPAAFQGPMGSKEKVAASPVTTVHIYG